VRERNVVSKITAGAQNFPHLRSVKPGRWGPGWRNVLAQTPTLRPIRHFHILQEVIIGLHGTWCTCLGNVNHVTFVEIICLGSYLPCLFIIRLKIAQILTAPVA